MIAKKYRMNEREVKKVLWKWKPFFSYGSVINFQSNRLDYNRFSIVIGWKSVRNAVVRNFFRRKFYALTSVHLYSKQKNVYHDIVFVVKKQTKLERDNKKNVANFQNDIHFLMKKILSASKNNIPNTLKKWWKK